MLGEVVLFCCGASNSDVVYVFLYRQMKSLRSMVMVEVRCQWNAIRHNQQRRRWPMQRFMLHFVSAFRPHCPHAVQSCSLLLHMCVYVGQKMIEQVEVLFGADWWVQETMYWMRFQIRRIYLLLQRVTRRQCGLFPHNFGHLLCHMESRCGQNTQFVIGKQQFQIHQL